MRRIHWPSACLVLCVVWCASAAGERDDAESGEPDLSDTVLVEGDIRVPREAVDDGRATYASNLWPNGVIPYVFDANVSAGNRNNAMAAMAVIEGVCAIDFRVRTNEANYVRIRAQSPDSSFVGMVGGQQLVTISSWLARYVIVHELMHVAGFYHEQSRSDRDAYVQIQYQNVCQTCCGGGSCNFNFAIRPDAGPLGSNEYGPYDFDSVMHYSSLAFSANGMPTIVVLPPNEHLQNAIGQRVRISVWDAQVLRFLYPYSGDRFLDGAFSGVSDGSFLTPFTTFEQGAGGTPTDGVLFCQPGAYSAVGEWNGAMSIEAPLGDVTLGP